MVEVIMWSEEKFGKIFFNLVSFLTYDVISDVILMYYPHHGWSCSTCPEAHIWKEISIKPCFWHRVSFVAVMMQFSTNFTTLWPIQTLQLFSWDMYHNGSCSTWLRERLCIFLHHAPFWTRLAESVRPSVRPSQFCNLPLSDLFKILHEVGGQ